jgi:hypothetical protein
MELCALLLQLVTHGQVWSYMLRWPFSSVEAGKWRLTERAANNYARAASAAYPDVCQQARLLVEHCKVLERDGRLHDAQQELDAVVLESPAVPLQVLHALHLKYAPTPGPPLDCPILQLFDARCGWTYRDWEQECTIAEKHAVELEQQLQRDVDDGTSATSMTIEEQQQQAAQARLEADTLAARPRSFPLAMNRSLKFFHSDKRTGGTGEDDEFAQAKRHGVNSAHAVRIFSN